MPVAVKITHIDAKRSVLNTYDRILAGAQRGAESTADYLVRRSKQKAPVRRVFKGGRRHFGPAQSVDIPLGPRGGKRKTEIRGVVRQRSRPNLWANSLTARLVNQTSIEVPSERGRGFTPFQFRRSASGKMDRQDMNEQLDDFMSQVRAGQHVGRPALADPAYERYLTSQGRYLLKKSLALSARISKNPKVAKKGGYEIRLGGRLRHSIHWEDAPEDSDTKIAIDVLTDVPYARFVEYGTRRTRAQPFFRPTAAEARARHLLLENVKTQISVG